ncbi:hypothetical protein [Antarctobacter jejuensis]|uniref:hypothetical protein n=1 Tax=Antarctobacter jejuensis TaxID=1439938 RepID=UPI003FD2BAD6
MAKSRKDKTDDTKAVEDSLTSEDPKTPEETVIADEADTVADTVDAAEADPAPERDELADDVSGEDSLTETADSYEPDADALAGVDGADAAPAEGDDTLSGEDSLETAEPEAETSALAPQVIRETVVERKGGFGPMVLGGVVAAALGYAAGAYPDLPFMGGGAVEEDPFVTETKAALRSQVEQIETLTKKAGENADAISGIDLAPLSGSITAAEGKLTTLETTLTGLQSSVTGLSDQIKAMDTRLSTIEKQPLIDAVSPETVAAYERELDTLKAQVAAQQAAIAEAQKEQLAAVKAAKEEIEAVAARARDAETSAETRAKLAASRAALADLTTRARDGKPYAEPLAVLTGNGVAVPDALAQSAEDGLPTTSVLLSEFPAAARDALAAARANRSDDAENGGLAGFFQSQLGARSVTPREGNDPDAVLSRAEAALRGGDLDTTLSEISALPDVAQAELSDWVALATLRRDALAATAALSQELNQE